jgi:hypothetical protein
LNDLKIITRKEAIKLKLTRYFTGVECRKCGITCERYVKSGSCVECNRLDSKERYRKMLELFNAKEGSK